MSTIKHMMCEVNFAKNHQEVVAPTVVGENLQQC